MNNDDILRELNKITAALKWAEEHLAKDGESKAALHMSDRVLYSPLCTSVVAARKSAKKVADEISGGSDDQRAAAMDWLGRFLVQKYPAAASEIGRVMPTLSEHVWHIQDGLTSQCGAVGCELEGEQ